MASEPLVESAQIKLSKREALVAAPLLQASEVELLPTRALLEAASRIAIELDHFS